MIWFWFVGFALAVAMRAIASYARRDAVTEPPEIEIADPLVEQFEELERTVAQREIARELARSRVADGRQEYVIKQNQLANVFALAHAGDRYDLSRPEVLRALDAISEADALSKIRRRNEELEAFAAEMRRMDAAWAEDQQHLRMVELRDTRSRDTGVLRKSLPLD